MWCRIERRSRRCSTGSKAAQAEVAALSFDVLTGPEALSVKDRLETAYRRQAVDHRLTHHLTSHASPVALGAKSWTDCVGQPAAHRPRRGPPVPGGSRGLGPAHRDDRGTVAADAAHRGAAQAAGTIGAEHVHIIRRFFAELSTAVDVGPARPVRSTWPASPPSTPPMGYAKPLIG